jgi:hypothetical protein
MLIGVQVWGFVSSMVGSVIRGAVSLGLIHYDFNAHGRFIPTTLLVFSSLVGFSASLAFCWWLVSRQGPSLGVWVANLLRRHRLWYPAVIISCGLFLLSLISPGVTILQLKFTDLIHFGEIARSRQYYWLAGSVVQTATFVILILLLARNRLRPSKA